MTPHPYNIITKTIDGIAVTVTFYPDHDMGPPWMEHDGHGDVSGWKRRDCKAAGERVLCEHRGFYRFYDFAGAVKKARVEGWGLPPETIAELEAGKGRSLTRGEIASAAAEADFRYLRRWAEGEWRWLFAVAEAPGHPDETDSLGGINSDSMEFFAAEMAEGLARRIKEEAAAAHDAACRDIATI